MADCVCLFGLLFSIFPLFFRSFPPPPFDAFVSLVLILMTLPLVPINLAQILLQPAPHVIRIAAHTEDFGAHPRVHLRMIGIAGKTSAGKAIIFAHVKYPLNVLQH